MKRNEISETKTVSKFGAKFWREIGEALQQPKRQMFGAKLLYCHCKALEQNNRILSRLFVFPTECYIWKIHLTTSHNRISSAMQ